MTDNLGMGKDARRVYSEDILSGKQTFRDAFRKELESVTANGHSFGDCKEILKKSMHYTFCSILHPRTNSWNVSVDIKLDPGFKDFYTWCKANDIPVIIVSRYALSSSRSSWISRNIIVAE